MTVSKARLLSQAMSNGGSIESIVSAAALTSSDVTEGSNLYYTQQRFDSSLSLKTTDDLTEGSNLYYTQQRFDSSLSLKTTDDLNEGSNLYYTKSRTDSDISFSLQNLSYSIIPSQNITYDLGSPSKRFKDLYISNGTIYFGDSENDPTAKTLESATVAAIKDTTIYNINLSQQGELKILDGSIRWYAPFDVNIVEVLPRLGTAADANVGIVIQINDSDQFSFNIPSNSTSVVFTDSDQFSMEDGDYLTVDVTSVGNTLKGENLTIQFKYKKI